MDVVQKMENQQAKEPPGAPYPTLEEFAKAHQELRRVSETKTPEKWRRKYG